MGGAKRMGEGQRTRERTLQKTFQIPPKEFCTSSSHVAGRGTAPNLIVRVAATAVGRDSARTPQGPPGPATSTSLHVI